MSHKIAFREYGNGPLLVLLHGYGGNTMQWDDVVERLKDSYRVVVPNLSHLYLSKNRLLFPVIVEHLAEFLHQNYPGQKANLAGASFGGTLAWGLTLQRPELVDRLLLLNPLMPHPIEQFRLPETKYLFVLPMNEKSILRVFETPIGQSFIKKASEIFRPDRDSAERTFSRMTERKLLFIADLVSHFAWLLRNEDWKFWANRLSTITAPTLVVWAQDDLLFRESAYRDFAFQINAKKAVCWPQGGHVLSLSRPDEVANLILEFLAQVKSADEAA